MNPPDHFRICPARDYGLVVTGKQLKRIFPRNRAMLRATPISIAMKNSCIFKEIIILAV